MTREDLRAICSTCGYAWSLRQGEIGNHDVKQLDDARWLLTCQRTGRRSATQILRGGLTAEHSTA